MKQPTRQNFGLISLISVLISLLACLQNQPAYAVSANVTWVKSFAAAGGNSFVNATAVDSAGNVYIAGTYATATLTLGSITINRLGSTDGYIAKLNSSGTVVWAQTIGGSGASTTIWSMTIDSAATPNLYITGWFSGGSLTTPSASIIGTQDGFALKMPSTGGAATWVQNLGGSGANLTLNDIAIDNAATPNVYLAGGFSGADLTTPSVTKIGTGDAILIKLNGNNGTPSSVVQSFGQTGTTTSFNGVCIAVDNSSVATAYAVGSFSGGDLLGYTREGTADGIILEFDTSNGNSAWNHRVAGPSVSVTLNRCIADSSAAGSQQGIYVAGSFSGGNIDTPSSLTKIGNQDGLAFKMSISTSNFSWIQNFGGSTSYLSFLGVRIDTASTPNLYFAGNSSATLTVPALSPISAQQDAFAMRLPSTGGTTPGWVRNFGGPNTAQGNLRAIAIDTASTPNVYVGGYLKNADWTSPAVTLVGGAGSYNALSMKLAQISLPGAPTGVSASAGAGQASVSFSAPASDGNSTITSYTVTSSPGGITASGSTSPITVTGLTNGTSYTFTVTATNAAGTGSASSASSAVVPAAASSTSTTPSNTPPPSFLGTSTNGAVVPITISVAPPAGTTGGTSSMRTATAKLPDGVFNAPPGALNFSLKTGGNSSNDSVSSGKSGTISLSLPVASSGSSANPITAAISFNIDTRTFNFTAPLTTRSGTRSSVRAKSSNLVIRGANAAPAAPTYQVTAPSALAISTALSLTGTDSDGNSGTITIPVTLYAPAEIGDLVAASTDIYGNFGTAASLSPALSRDGQILSFLSQAVNFGINAPTGFNQVMRYSVPLGTVDFISQSSFVGTMGGSAPYGGDNFAPAISADGLVLAFPSDAKNIYPIYPIPNGRQIYLTPANSALGTLGSASPKPLSLNGNTTIGAMDRPALSSDGSILAFDSDYNWVPGVTTLVRQIYVKNRTTGTYRLASATTSGVPGNGNSISASISDDGRFVLFESDATNLTTTPNRPAARQIYLKDMTSGTLSLISAGLDGAPGNGRSANGKLAGIVPYNAQGMSAVFESDATNLVSPPSTGRQVYRRDISAQVTALISADSSGAAIGGSSTAISGDGRFIVYKSSGAPVGKASATGAAQIYVYDVFANKAALISTDANGLPANDASDTPAISGDGRTIAFASLATNLDGTVTNGVSQIYLAANPIAPPLANGFWANPDRPGVYAIEQSGNRVWFAAFSFDSNNLPTWTFASEQALTKTSFAGNLLQTAGGMPLTGGNGVPYIANLIGTTSLNLSGQTQAVLSMANASTTIQRSDFVSNGSSQGQAAGYPETGWWYAPSTGQSLFLEVQGQTLTANIASYTASGDPTWYQTSGAMPAANAYSGSLTCLYGSNLMGCSNAASLSLAFSSPLAGSLTLPGTAKPIAIQRWRF